MKCGIIVMVYNIIIDVVNNDDNVV